MEKLFSVLRMLMVLLSICIGTFNLSGCGEGGTEIGNPNIPGPTEGPADGEGDPTDEGEPSEEEENPETEPTIQGGGS